jgi:hypothetical protein
MRLVRGRPVAELESCSFSGIIADAAGAVLGEARLWGAGERGDGGTWTGWLRVADLGGKLLPGRYTVTTPAGWQGAFETEANPPARVFETELLPIIGVGPVPWPARDSGQ